MNIPEVLRALDAQIAQLQQVRQLLGDSVAPSPSSTKPGKRRGRPPGVAKAVEVEPQPAGKRSMSAEGKARIAAAQKKRWAKRKKAAKAAAPIVTGKQVASPTKMTTAKKTATPAKKVTVPKGSAQKAVTPAKKVAAKKPANTIEKPAASKAPKAVETVEHSAAPAPLPEPITAEA